MTTSYIVKNPVTTSDIGNKAWCTGEELCSIFDFDDFFFC